MVSTREVSKKNAMIHSQSERRKIQKLQNGSTYSLEGRDYDAWMADFAAFFLMTGLL